MRRKTSVVRQPVFHGSQARFACFERRSGKRYILFSEYDVQSPAFFFAPTALEAAEYGCHVTAWKIDVRRPFVNAETEPHLGVGHLDDARFLALAHILEPLIKTDQCGRYIDVGVRRSDLKDGNWPYLALGRGGLNWDVTDCVPCIERLVALGYDGTTVHEDSESGYSWAVFDPAQAVKLDIPVDAAFDDGVCRCPY